MKNRNKSNSLSIKLFSYFTLFTTIMLLLLWVFQIAFLEPTYRILRTLNVRSSTKSIVNTIITSPNERSRRVDIISTENNISTVIYDMQSRRIIYRSNPGVITNLFREIQEEDLLDIVDRLSTNEDLTLYIVQSAENGRIGRFLSENPRGSLRAIVYIMTADINGSPSLVVTFGDVLPVNSTKMTLRVQLIIISFIVIAASLVISSRAARKISKPIAQINDDAKIMASGNYDIEFHGTGYSEIEELSTTLSNTAIQLKKVDKMSRQLVANVSHDLRTPLTMISGYGEIIRDVPGENTPENVQVIIDEANRLTTLVNNLLDISKLESDTIQLNIVPINVETLMENVLSSYSRLSDTKGVDIKLEIDDPTINFMGDPIHLTQVFQNLINNAINHVGEDKTVYLKCTRCHGKVQFEVIDHGDGISEEDLPHIWERYYKADKRHTHTRSGSGLGLAIVKIILELHKAEYGVKTGINKGADFWFRLPILTKEEAK